MSWLSGLFKPRQDNFIRLLIEQAAWVVKGLDALSVYVLSSDARADAASSGASGMRFSASNRSAAAKTRIAIQAKRIHRDIESSFVILDLSRGSFGLRHRCRLPAFRCSQSI